jgi:hypothetical protein
MNRNASYRGMIGALAAAAALLVSPAAASAIPPSLDSIDLAPGNDHPTLHWSLPPGVDAQGDPVQAEFLQTATSSETDVDGYFLQKRVVTFTTLDPTQTLFQDLHEYPDGTYYAHVAGHDPGCVGGKCEQVQFSNVLSFSVVPAPPGSGGGGGGSGGGADKFAPLEALSFSPVQHVGKLFVTVRSSESGTVRATGTTSTSGAAKVFRFKPVSRSVKANAKTKLRLRLAKKSLRAVKRALKKRKKLKAKINVSAIDKAGNRRTQKAVIRLIS